MGLYWGQLSVKEFIVDVTHSFSIYRDRVCDYGTSRVAGINAVHDDFVSILINCCILRFYLTMQLQ